MDVSDAEISGHALTDGHLDDVTGDESFGLLASPLSVAKDTALRCLHGLEGLQSAVSVRVLPNGNDGVEDKDKQNDEGLNVGSEAFFSVT